MSSSREIVCPACDRQSLLVREPLYEGFKRVGEELPCAACGHRFASESEVQFKKTAAAPLFDESDRPKAMRVFAENEAEHICRRCARTTS